MHCLKRILILILLSPLLVIGQNNKQEKDFNKLIDSLKHAVELKKGVEKAGLLNKLAFFYYNSSPDTTIYFSQKAFRIADSIKDNSNISTALNGLAVGYTQKGEFYKALEYYLRSLKIRERMNDSTSIIASHNNLGILYQNMKNYKEALIHFQLCLDLRERTKDEWAIAAGRLNIALVYQEMGLYDQAIGNYTYALRVFKTKDDSPGIAECMDNIGWCLLQKKQMDKPVAYFDSSIVYWSFTKNTFGIGMSNYHKGCFYLINNEPNRALQFLLLAELYLKSSGARLHLSECFHQLGIVYSKLEQFEKAYYYTSQFSSIQDSVLSAENSKQMAEMATRFDSDKKDKEISERKVELKQKEIEVSTQKAVRNASVIALLMAIIALFFIIRGYGQKEKANEMISMQKKEVEEKNKEITDSINYAQRIQQAILIPETELAKSFSEAFVIYKPKDIVSGDFYWFGESDTNKIIAVADCTGHGVPGGFMSMLGYEILQEVLLLENVETTSDALEILNKKVTETLIKITVCIVMAWIWHYVLSIKIREYYNILGQTDLLSILETASFMN